MFKDIQNKRNIFTKIIGYNNLKNKQAVLSAHIETKFIGFTTITHS